MFKGFIKDLGGYSALRRRLAFLLMSVCLIAVSLMNSNNSEIAVSGARVLNLGTVFESTEAIVIPEIKAPEPIPVAMSVETAQNDIRIKFYNEQLELFTGVAFEVSVKYPNGTARTFHDKDTNGRINLNGISAGKYIVSMVVPEGYTLIRNDMEINVKDKVEYKVIKDVKDDTKKESEAGNEESQKKDTPQEVVLKDTVEFVTSSESVKVDYTAVSFADVKAPSGEPSTETGESTTSLLPTEPTTAPGTTEPTTGNLEAPLTDKSGNALYIKSGDNYVPATESNYSEAITFYKRVETKTYTGWQRIDGRTYYFDKNGKAVTGTQVIAGARYNFGTNGVLTNSTGILGIDVSNHQNKKGEIDWKAVKAAGVHFVILRCGFRGYGEGTLYEDASFKKNLAGAQAAGLDIGVYLYSTAINEVEAVEEASLCVSLLAGKKIAYPIFYDIETANGGNGRADKLTKAQYTANAVAFCETVRNAGYKAGVYANKYYLTSKLDTAQLNKYYIWLAHYTDKTNYEGKYDLWQYSSQGKIPGITGNVDMNFSYSF